MSQIKTGDVNWEDVRQRFIKLLDLYGSIQKVAEKYQIDPTFLEELGQAKKQNKFDNIRIFCDKLGISPRWFLTGKGNFQKKTKQESEIKIRRGAGIRRSDYRRSVEEGEITDEALDFVLAIDDFKRKNKKHFLSSTDLYQVIQFLGYRKVAAPADDINKLNL